MASDLDSLKELARMASEEGSPVNRIARDLCDKCKYVSWPWQEALSEGFSVQLKDLNLSSVRFSGLLARLLGVPPARLGGALAGLIGPFFGLGGL